MTKVTIKIERPDGTIEVVDVSAKFYSMNDALFAGIRKATAAAGKGNALSYDVVREDNRTDGEKAWDAVDAKIAQAERAMAEGNNARYLTLRAAADEARTNWADDYPEAAKARADEAAARKAIKAERLSHSHVANQRD